MKKIVVFALFIVVLLLVTACPKPEESGMRIKEGTEKQDVKEVPIEEKTETGVTPTQQTPSTPSTPSQQAQPSTPQPSQPTQTPTETKPLTKTQEILAPMYEKIKKGIKYEHRGDIVYVKGTPDNMKMAIEFSQMYTLPGTQSFEFPRAAQIDVAFFDMTKNTGKGYCLGRVKGSEFSCNDLQGRAFNLKFSEFVEQYSLYYLEMYKDQDPDSYAARAERVNNVATARVNYGGEDGITIWISDFYKMPIKAAMRRQDPYTKELHYANYEFGVPDEKFVDPFA